MTSQQHRSEGPEVVRCAVVTVSDTRTHETDASGALVAEHLASAHHVIAARHIVRDDPSEIDRLLRELAAGSEIDAILVTGGTGLGSRDLTFETVSRLLTKALPGYGELFRWLSYAEIGPAAMLSRAVGGLMGRIVLLTMPGSPHAVRLAMDKVILPELGHLVREARR
ncbi:MAG TPA: MogA/MoaB family molybdenum cofactor biosynthesis protein [Pirellulales bacterium]|nr:MogA/MoaB family molybdenum cofactor biosynthesis protein [Pirellulales bacterium]